MEKVLLYIELFRDRVLCPCQDEGSEGSERPPVKAVLRALPPQGLGKGIGRTTVGVAVGVA